MTIFRCFLSFKTVVMPQNVIVFKIKISLPKTDHLSHARSLVPRAASWHKAAYPACLCSRPIAAAINYVTSHQFLHSQLREEVWRHPHVIKVSLDWSSGIVTCITGTGYIVRTSSEAVRTGTYSVQTGTGNLY
jgi:hypothetical protein